MASRQKDYYWQDSDPLWYKDAIIYELHIRAFYDSNGDGIGDFKGLTEKLGYLQDLGVTTIWLLPFYPSPLKDDGYDIAEYTSIHPNYGTMRDFKNFIREANRYGLRVITELVLNHTSDQHPWFKRSRRSISDNKWRDFYVWSDTPDKYKDARIIFKDFESSNWNWDHVVKAYYWHRFYSHQPDLNFDNPLVRQTMFDVLNFWLETGVSGLRLDAVPYLYEREGTNCENLPETHAFLKELRNHIDENFSSRMLLAEANQWAEDAVAYFGNNDECHMSYHFPLMPRMFMAIRREDRFPIVDILEQTPEIPEECQWALFLRNHDELTLEMVTDEERDYMYRVYAHDIQARINLGIRRRLAPLLSNDRRKIELMNGLLLSLPGTPIIYYGDEIGMGDNFYLGDRNSVRTPMQWNSDRNAGFSFANPQQLYLPVNIAPEYHYETINVEVQQNNTDSLLWWMKRLISLRKRFKALSRGTLEILFPENRKIFAFIRRYQNEAVLVLANLSHLIQHTSINLSSFNGMVPVEVAGRVEFPRITESPYFFTLGPYAFYWFSLETKEVESFALQPADTAFATITMTGEWRNLFKRETRAVLSATLIDYIRPRRWFGGKSRSIRAYNINDTIAINYDTHTSYIVFIDVEYTEGEAETYQLPISYASGDSMNELISQWPQAVIAYVKNNSDIGIIYDAASDSEFCMYLMRAVANRKHFKSAKGEVIFSNIRGVFRKNVGKLHELSKPHLMKVEQTNTSIIYGDRAILKFYRHIEEGINPEVEMGQFLTEGIPFLNSPVMLGAIEYRRLKGPQPIALGIIHTYTQNEGDAWQYTLDEIGRYLEHVVVLPNDQVPLPSGKSLIGIGKEKPPKLVMEIMESYMASAKLLGQRTAELHLRLASAIDDPYFTPEFFSTMYQRSIFQTMRAQSAQVLRTLRYLDDELPEDAKVPASQVLKYGNMITEQYQALLKGKIRAARIRCHGDYHLGQILYTGKDFMIIDFEGEPARPASERRIKRSPLVDIAAMIRSFHYAIHIALSTKASTMLRAEDVPSVEKWADAWYLWVSATFLNAYLELMTYSNILPEDEIELKTLLDCYLLQKAFYEVSYELNNRPNWVSVPLKGILHVLDSNNVI